MQASCRIAHGFWFSIAKEIGKISMATFEREAPNIDAVG